MVQATRLWVVLLLLPIAAAEQVNHELFTDASGDVVLSTQDGSLSQPDATGFYANVDLVGGGVWAEDDDTVTFYLQFDDLTDDSQVPLPFSDPDYYLYFRHGDQGYRVFVATALENPFNGVIGRSGDLRATLDQQVNAFQYRSIAEADVTLDTSEELAKITVPRGALVDHNQAPLARNATLTDIHAESRSMGWFGFPIVLGGSPGSDATYVGIPMASDAAPEDGPTSYQMVTGTIQQRGSIFAVSDDPVRWTNGEATTLTFQSRITNTGSEELSLRADVVGTDNSWDVAYSDRITVPSGTAVNHTVLVTIPFSHQHGSTHLFEARFGSDDGDHAATSVLGVHWPEIPQPAGHHNELWLHSIPNQATPPFDTLFPSVHGWFSAKSDLDGDEGTPIPPLVSTFPGFFGAQEGRAIWILNLEPELRMGLDFRPGESGLLNLGFQLPIPVLDAALEAQLIHQLDTQGRGGFGGTTLMQAQSETLSGTSSGGIDFELDFFVVDGIDDMPYDPDANLALVLDLSGTFLFGAPGVQQASIVPTLDPSTSSMKLPLNEYHDPADLSFQTDGSIAIDVGQQGQERFVNPGKTVVYTFELRYDGNAATQFEATLSGANKEWGQIIGDTVFDLDGTSRPLAISVTAPEDALDGEQADITLTIANTANSALQAGIGTLTTVTSSRDIPDEADYGNELAGELTEEKDSPGIGAGWIIALAAVALLRRR